jgi:hypothetical protein
MSSIQLVLPPTAKYLPQTVWGSSSPTAGGAPTDAQRAVANDSCSMGSIEMLDQCFQGHMQLCDELRTITSNKRGAVGCR